MIHVWQNHKKTQVRDMIYEYREAFSLRDEIGTCPNIEIDIYDI